MPQVHLKRSKSKNLENIVGVAVKDCKNPCDENNVFLALYDPN